MHVNPRPSKSTFRDYFNEVILEKIGSNPKPRVLDAACAQGKYRSVFSECEYHGVDIQENVISSLNQQYSQDDTTFFFHEDITSFSDKIKDSYYDLVVSTHTLCHLDRDSKKLALNNLVSKTALGKDLIIQCHTPDLDLIESQSKNFRSLTIKSYRGLFSQLFEKLLAKIFNTNNVADLGKRGRIGLFQKTKYLVYISSLVLRKIDPFFFPSHHLAILEGKKS